MDVPPQPTGHEPPIERWNARLGHAEWFEVQPTQCQRRHPYRIGTPDAQLSISWVGCGCSNANVGGGHHVYLCRTVVDGKPCGDANWIPTCADPNRQAESHRKG